MLNVDRDTLHCFESGVLDPSPGKLHPRIKRRLSGVGILGTITAN
jgi:hypothetical protein